MNGIVKNKQNQWIGPLQWHSLRIWSFISCCCIATVTATCMQITTVAMLYIPNHCSMLDCYSTS